MSRLKFAPQILDVLFFGDTFGLKFKLSKIYIIFRQPNNILLMTEHAYPEIKIIDFGLARQIKDGEQICLIVGTPEYVGKCCICIFITHHALA